MLCHSMPYHINTHAHEYSEHNVQDVFADYNQTNLLYYYSYAIYYIYIYTLSVCVFGYRIEIEVNGKLFAIESVRKVE